jgi:hypothetical protein
MLAVLQQPVEAPAEALTTRQWAKILVASGVSKQESAAVRLIQLRKFPSEMRIVKGGTTNVIKFDDLPENWRVAIDEQKAERYCKTAADILRPVVQPSAWKPTLKRTETSDYNQSKCKLVWQVIDAYEKSLETGSPKAQAELTGIQVYERMMTTAIIAREPWAFDRHGRPRKTRVSQRQIRNWLERVEAAGGHGSAPLEAYGEFKNVAHVPARKVIPEDFVVALCSKCVEPGVVEMRAAFRHFELEWKAGNHVPGFGRAEKLNTPFPLKWTPAVWSKLPGYTTRVIGGQGRFKAKAKGLLPALPIASTELRLRERIVMDDKRFDGIAKRDSDGKACSVHLYIAMDECNRAILGYLLREDGALKEADVEALHAFVMRECGFAGKSAGYATTFIYERGTVAISKERENLLRMMFGDQIEIDRTRMITHHVPGAFKDKPSGNFFGKGKLESFMGALDHYTRHIQGQRGNVFANEPLMLGDVTLTAERMRSKKYKPKGSMIEEAILTAQVGQALHWAKTGEVIPAVDAAQTTGVKGPLLYIRELHVAIQAAIAYYNQERGTRREGLATIAVEKPEGGLDILTESPADKAARLERELAAQGRSLQRISPEDVIVLLHKVKHVTVTPSGCKTSIGGTERLYWHKESRAMAAAQDSTFGEKAYLALYNHEDPRELYLLSNPPGSVARTADRLPEGMAPVFFEALPLYVPPQGNDEEGKSEQRREVEYQQSRVLMQLNRAIVPFVNAQTERREKNIELTEPSARPSASCTPKACAWRTLDQPRPARP